MRKALMGLLTAALCLSMGGCAVQDEIENQAYVLVLGIDRADDGALRLTARVPRIGKNRKTDVEGGSEQSAYLTFSASGEDWARALQGLQMATPRSANLSHIEMLVVSSKLAGETGFPEVARRIAETPHLYTNARFAVCEGSAEAFVAAGDVVIGSRLSADIKAMLRHFADEGTIPDSSFADMVYASNSFYSDPMAIWCRLEDGGDASGGETSPGDGKSLMKQRFAGTALFRQGVFVRALGSEQTRMLNCARGKRGSFPLFIDGGSLELTPTVKPHRRVSIEGGTVRLVLELEFSTLDGAEVSVLKRAEQALQGDLEDVIRTCQRLQTDPFGFAEIAAGQFTTAQDWLQFEWRRRFAEAEPEVVVHIHPSGSDG